MNKDDGKWKEKLTPEQYQIMREKGTETAFSGKYWNHHENGMYACAACGKALFASDTKFDSGTGWPSFTDVAEKGNVILQDDDSHGMRRTEVVCANCGGHLGHLFDDGPKEKGGRRYCINSSCLMFQAQNK